MYKLGNLISDFKNNKDKIDSYINEFVQTMLEAAKVQKMPNVARGDVRRVATTRYKEPAETVGDKAHAVTAGDKSPATTTGSEANVATTGFGAPAVTTGYKAPAATTNEWSPVATEGLWSPAVTTGQSAPAATMGQEAPAATMGSFSPAVTTGIGSNAVTMGEDARAATMRSETIAVTTGPRSCASVNGKKSVACALGQQSTARGIKDSWIGLVEWQPDELGNEAPINAKFAQIGNPNFKDFHKKVLRENQEYMLVDGKFTPAEEIYETLMIQQVSSRHQVGEFEVYKGKYTANERYEVEDGMHYDEEVVYASRKVTKKGYIARNGEVVALGKKIKEAIADCASKMQRQADTEITEAL